MANDESLKDEKTAEEKALDDWLPVTSARNAKWYYSAFHNVTAMVGAGVLSLPYALSELGWYVIFFQGTCPYCFQSLWFMTTCLPI